MYYFIRFSCQNVLAVQNTFNNKCRNVSLRLKKTPANVGMDY